MIVPKLVFRCSVLLACCLGACAEPSPLHDDGDARDSAREPASSAQVAAQQAAPTRNRQLALGRAHGCSLDAEISGVLCWGDNARGQAKPPSLRSPRFIAAGGDTTCAIAAGGVSCWGDDSRGQRSVPRGLQTPTQLAVGDGHVCALGGGGVITCWGDDSKGQLRAPAVRDALAIAAGARHTCARTATSVVCWGDGELGQLAVPALTRPTQLAVGAAHACAIDEGARVVCWGGAVPALRDDVPAVSKPTAIAAGGSHSCVVDGERVVCWGAEGAVRTPRELTKPSQIALGGSGGQAFGCARHLQGVACWGDDSLAQTRYSGAPLHLMYRGQADIRAPAALVWEILMDLDAYPAWNPYTIAMQSTLTIGAPMVMSVKMSPQQTLSQTEYIRVLEPGHKVCWGIDTPTPALNSGERCQWLEPLPDGGTRYITEDLIEGTLNGLVSGLFGADVKRGFEAVASALKVRAEQLASAP